MSNSTISQAVKLSHAQRELLAKATIGDGTISLWYVRQATLDVLVSLGMIVKDKRVRSELLREDERKKQAEYIAKAKTFLDAGEWQKARAGLDLANGCESELKAECYWITDAGKEAIKA